MTKDRLKDFDKNEALKKVNEANEAIQSLKRMVKNPALIKRINEMNTTLLWLSQNMNKEKDFRTADSKAPQKKKQTKKKQIIHYESKGRNAHRSSGLHNIQGGFGKKATYHVKGYED